MPRSASTSLRPASGGGARAFLRESVRHLLVLGIRQFLDVGSGIPTVGNVHEVALAADPQARVVYMDIDSVAVIHAQQLLSGNDRANAIAADLRHPEAILAHRSVRETLDLPGRSGFGWCRSCISYPIPSPTRPWRGCVKR